MFINRIREIKSDLFAQVTHLAVDNDILTPSTYLI